MAYKRYNKSCLDRHKHGEKNKTKQKKIVISRGLCVCVYENFYVSERWKIITTPHFK